MENNPYAAPRANVADVAPEPRKRPLLVWIISVFIVIGIVGGLATSVAGLLGSPIGGPEANKGMGMGDYLWATVLSLASIPVYVDLFRLKRRALPGLIALFVVAAAALCANLALRPEYRALFEQNPAGYWGIVVGWVINLAIIGYAWRLRRKGTLQ